MKTMVDTSIFHGIIEFTATDGNEYRCDYLRIYRRQGNGDFLMIGYFDAKKFGTARPASILRAVQECGL